jgi:hypothetical protein
MKVQRVRGSSHKGDRALEGLIAVSTPDNSTCPTYFSSIFWATFWLWGTPHPFLLVSPCFARSWRPRPAPGPAWATRTTYVPQPTHQHGARPHWPEPAPRWEGAVAGQRGGLCLGPGSGLPNGAAQRGARATGGKFSDGSRCPERTTPI